MQKTTTTTKTEQNKTRQAARSVDRGPWTGTPRQAVRSNRRFRSDPAGLLFVLVDKTTQIYMYIYIYVCMWICEVLANSSFLMYVLVVNMSVHPTNQPTNQPFVHTSSIPRSAAE
ncbi:hypothetical protein K491DRAFT_390416 [Lophiostoma macrostomum CBS 122681]|uniref:Uncharacterized protein n=1 Tax=Lophiostoma macrostomum CBS 122681 TaxID=1314788 RepID=A0A6A6TAK2_9PLEO|nr:hypothetical protein K491DRAFT_390416 [Lophiostoma macrostomum CBS 122681]